MGSGRYRSGFCDGSVLFTNPRMTNARLVRQNLTHYWRTNLAVVLGVAAAVAVLAGALLVGDSVRASLRDLVVQRLGQTDQAIVATGFFREQLAADVQEDAQFATAGFAAACPLIALEATVTHEGSRRVASAIKVYGVDERFWKFNKLEDQQPPRNREALASDALARELGANPGDSLVVRVHKPSEIPAESLHSKKDELGSTLRLIVREVLSADSLGEFSLQPQQGSVRAVFVPLKLLQEEVEQPSSVNLILLSEGSRDRSDPARAPAKTELIESILRDRTSLEDFGITLRVVGEPRSISVEHDSKLLSDSLALVAGKAADSSPQLSVLSYLANTISFGERSIPYSLISAIDEPSPRASPRVIDIPEAGLFPQLRDGLGNSPLQATGEAEHHAPILLNAWAAQDLGTKPGDVVSVEYYLWHEGGRLETKSERFQVRGILPIQGIAADKGLVPDYPGITGTEDLSEWDPPFPVGLKRVREKDEDYWDQYRTTPKAFIPLAIGQSLWQSRFGKLTSLRIYPSRDTSFEQALDTYSQKLRAELDPKSMGFTVIPVRSQGLNASRGATDFGEYFLYFSFFLVVSALLLTSLFFKLGIEQRLREIGVLQAVGVPASRIRSLFLAEGLLLAVAGSLIGLLGAVAYGELMMYGLRTWWVGAVGTTRLSLHVSLFSLLLGAGGGIIAALACVAWTLRGLKKQTTRSLLTGTLSHDDSSAAAADRPRRITVFRVGSVLALLALALLIASSFHLIGQTGGFFGGGMLLLVAALCFQSVWLRRGGGNLVGGEGWSAVARLGFRNATYRPARSVVCIALIASAAFIIVSVDAFRRGANGDNGLKSGSGGFSLQARSVVPLVHDVNSSEGREALNLSSDAAPALATVTLTRFRERPGDDASCLNLYQPQNPRILGATEQFIQANRFAFNDSISAEPSEAQNPWLLLNRELGDDVVPVMADATSLAYVLHLKLGDEFVLNRPNGSIRLRIVGALADSIFQSELVMSEKNFLRLFPEQEGYSFFLIDSPQKDLPAVASNLEDTLSDYGFDVVSTDEKLASFHRVENTYLSTFQMLGGLGLLLGTLGMAAVLLRNVLERRRELALLRAVGYNSSHFTLMVVAENAYLLFCGLVIGTVCALLAIAPVFFTRSAQVGSISLGLLLGAVLISGLTASIIATWAALRSPLIPALRAE